MPDNTPSPLKNVIKINDERIKSHLDRVVRGTVEETLNALLDAEADRLCNAQRHERSASGRDTHERGLQTKAGKGALGPQHLQPRPLDQDAGDRRPCSSDPRRRGHRDSAREGQAPAEFTTAKNYGPVARWVRRIFPPFSTMIGTSRVRHAPTRIVAAI